MRKLIYSLTVLFITLGYTKAIDSDFDINSTSDRIVSNLWKQENNKKDDIKDFLLLVNHYKNNSTIKNLDASKAKVQLYRTELLNITEDRGDKLQPVEELLKNITDIQRESKLSVQIIQYSLAILANKL